MYNGIVFLTVTRMGLQIFKILGVRKFWQFFFFWKGGGSFI